jgi:hypothetical protein
MTLPPRTVTATTFKAHCLALMDEVERTGQALLITRDVVNPDPADAAGWEQPL